jgi:hypothetical protein
VLNIALDTAAKPDMIFRFRINKDQASRDSSVHIVTGYGFNGRGAGVQVV